MPEYVIGREAQMSQSVWIGATLKSVSVPIEEYQPHTSAASTT